MKQKADLILINGLVYSVNEKFEVFESFAVKEGKFRAIGSSAEILENFSSEKIVDVKGKAVFPGFIDAHCHFYGLGMTMQQVDLVGSKSFDEVLERIITFQKDNKIGFIKGRGWNQNEWEVKEFPSKEKLDKLFPNTPVAINRIDGHAMLANQVALDLANITLETTVDGGEILKTDSKLNGILIDNAMNLVNEIIPKASKLFEENALQDAERACFKYGLTSVHDADLNRDTIELMQEMQAKNTLKMRLYTMVFATDESLDYYLTKGKIKTDKLNVGAFKIYMDGALGSKGARMKEPYLNNGHKKGVLVCSEEKLFRYAKRISDSDFQLNVHAIGDMANHLVLKTFVDDVKIPKARRWRVEHAQIVDESDFKYYETIMPSAQPTHATSDMYWAEKILGADRMKGAYAYKRLLNLYGRIPLGTDFPIEQVNPFLTFYAAAARKDTKGYPENGFQTENALTREETIKGMTIWGAYAAFEENEKGSIEKGKFADFVVLDQDIMKVDIDLVPKTKVLKTVLGGEVVFEN